MQNKCIHLEHTYKELLNLKNKTSTKLKQGEKTTQKMGENFCTLYI